MTVMEKRDWNQMRESDEREREMTQRRTEYLYMVVVVVVVEAIEQKEMKEMKDAAEREIGS